ncbi:L,D-transpeptidase family protein [Streptomyces sp. NPDC057746]|uniref:L,D-transpeptidase family protein n=1 Tax=unclassified Streptomyces TaxID=2593676 RepID=UPI0033B94D8E
MRTGDVNGTVRSRALGAACGVLLMFLSACGGSGAEPGRSPGARAPTRAAGPPAAMAEPPDGGPEAKDRLPGVGERLYESIPAYTGQAVVVYGDDEDSPDSEIVFYEREGPVWYEAGRWWGHNGRAGWTTDHHEDDLRTPVGVFTLTDAGGVLDYPGSGLPYDHNAVSYRVPEGWGEKHRNDFDHVIAIDYNRIPGTPPSDPTRPEGQKKGGGIWMHVDHGDGTSGCVTLPEDGLDYLLHTLDPERRPVVVMGDRRNLEA